MMKLDWKDKCRLALRETLTLNDIMGLRECGMPKAREIRKKAIDYCLMNGLEIDSRSVPAEAVFKVTGFELQDYFDKLKLELQVTA